LFADAVHTFSFKILEAKNRNSQIFHASFSKYLKLYRILQIWLHIASRLSEQFTGLLVGLGVVLTAICGCGAIKLYGEVPLIIYFACCLIVVLSETINFGFIKLASTPNKNEVLFKTYWKYWVKSRMARMQLRSCPPIGISVGFVRHIKAHTSFTIADSTLNMTVTFALVN